MKGEWPRAAARRQRLKIKQAEGRGRPRATVLPCCAGGVRCVGCGWAGHTPFLRRVSSTRLPAPCLGATCLHPLHAVRSIIRYMYMFRLFTVETCQHQHPGLRLGHFGRGDVCCVHVSSGRWLAISAGGPQELDSVRTAATLRRCERLSFAFRRRSPKALLKWPSCSTRLRLTTRSSAP